MEVTEEKYFPGLLSFFHHELRMIIDWIKFGAGANPLPIEILTYERTSIVANDDTIWVQHRYNFENESISQILGFFIVTD
jgi:hypothetical protein